MAKPRVFISSTFYDLRQIRSDIDQFISSLGYEPVRNEEGDIPYGRDSELQEYCYKEIKNCDILISIIGGRYGSDSNQEAYSVSQKELKTAIDEKKQVYIFIEQSVLGEYETYLLNKNTKDVQYKYVDNVQIYKFIEEIKRIRTNNNIKGFDSTQDIIKYLREQLAGLFKTLLEEQSKVKETNLILQLEKASSSLNQMITLMSEKLEATENKTDDVKILLKITHPLVTFLKEKLIIPYNFYVDGINDLKLLLQARGFIQSPNVLNTKNYKWEKDANNAPKHLVIKISKTLFDENGDLKFMTSNNWNSDCASFETINKVLPADDMPF